MTKRKIATAKAPAQTNVVRGPWAEHGKRNAGYILSRDFEMPANAVRLSQRRKQRIAKVTLTTMESVLLYAVMVHLPSEARGWIATTISGLAAAHPADATAAADRFASIVRDGMGDAR